MGLSGLEPWPGSEPGSSDGVARGDLSICTTRRSARETPSAGCTNCRAQPAEAPSLKARLERVERREIRQALTRQGGSVSAAAKELKMGLSTLYRRMQALGVEADG